MLDDLGAEHGADGAVGQTAEPLEQVTLGHVEPGVVRLARAAKRTGTSTVRLDGRLWINVSFGDFPYALRLTPAR